MIRTGDIIRFEADWFGRIETEEAVVLEVKGHCDECRRDALMFNEDTTGSCTLADGFFHLRCHKPGIGLDGGPGPSRPATTATWWMSAPESMSAEPRPLSNATGPSAPRCAPAWGCS